MNSPRNIIIIEDNETFSLLVTHYLKNNLGNVKVYVENSGARAIESIKRLKPSLVVLDYYLENDLSAKDVMEVINSMPTKPKVILLSSITDEQEKKEVMAMGIDEFVPKSNESFYDLVRSIEYLLSQLSSENENDESNSHFLFSKRGLAGLLLLLGILIAVLLLYLL
ncbi:MAG: response regulator [Salibacteraceae bacterium]